MSSNSHEKEPVHDPNFTYRSLRTGDFDEEEVVPDDTAFISDLKEQDEEVTTDEISFSSNDSLAQQRRAQQNELLKFLESSIDRLSRVSLQLSNEIDAHNHQVEHLEIENLGMQSESERIRREQRHVEQNILRENYCFIIFFVVVTIVLLILIGLKYYFKYYYHPSTANG